MKRSGIMIVLSLFVISVLFAGAFIVWYFERNAFSIKYYDIVKEACDEYSLDLSFVLSVIKTESDFKSDAVSKSGAIGLMQIMPETGRELYLKNNENFTESLLFVPEININLGCFYLSELLQKTGSYKWALASYNAGLSNALKWKDSDMDYQNFPFKETSDYIKKIKGNIKGYAFYRNLKSNAIIEN